MTGGARYKFVGDHPRLIPFGPMVSEESERGYNLKNTWEWFSYGGKKSQFDIFWGNIGQQQTSWNL